jgi:hypothetical protein
VNTLCQENLTQPNLLESEAGLNPQQKQQQQGGTGKRVGVHVCPWCEKKYLPKRKVQKFCSNSCSAKNTHKNRRRPIDEKLWPYLKITDSGCWEWQRARDWDGYGVVSWNNEGLRDYRAHRVAWILTFGEIPDGMLVCHKCDNPPCCNPMHLFCGTHKDNTQDCIQKGRFKGDPDAHGNRARGERASKSKLTESDVHYIREHCVFRSRQCGASVMGRKFGVSKAAILAIIHRRSWSHV